MRKPKRSKKSAPYQAVQFDMFKPTPVQQPPRELKLSDIGQLWIRMGAKFEPEHVII